MQDCYESVASVANQWLDVLDERGENMDDLELLDLISEKKTISKTLDDYEGRKATSLTTAGRLADFLGSEMVKDKGLNCKLIISKYPLGAPTTDRAIPVAIFSADIATRQYYLRKWLKAPALDCEDFREVVDWEYYKDRLGKSIQKIITIPAGMQRVANPVPRIEHPNWLQKRLNDLSTGLKQRSITSMFASKIIQASAFPSNKKSKGVDTVSPQAPKRVTFQSPDQSNSSRKRLFSEESSSESSKPEEPAEDVVLSTPSNKDVAQETSSPVIPLIERSKSPLSPEDDLQLWLQDRQKKWREKRQEKKLLSRSNRFQFKDDRYPVTKKPVALSDFVRNAALATTYGYWQIIEFQQMDAPGEFIVWAITQQNLQRIRVTIPRIMYVNCIGSAAEKTAQALGGVKVVRDLPHGRPCRNLYEVSVSEVREILYSCLYRSYLSR